MTECVPEALHIWWESLPYSTLIYAAHKTTIASCSLTLTAVTEKKVKFGKSSPTITMMSAMKLCGLDKNATLGSLNIHEAYSKNGSFFAHLCCHGFSTHHLNGQPQ